MAAALLACDWGTTNLRAWLIDHEGAVLRRHVAPGLGVGRLKPGEAAQRFRTEVRPLLGAQGLPAILCGMVGSNLGWQVAPYVDCPVTLRDLWAARLTLHEADGPVHIVPGVRGRGPAGQGDVMRGEETQLFGWMEDVAEGGRGSKLVCQPGTHSKWMRVDEGRLVGFVTAMTGEVFDLLRRHSVIRPSEPTSEVAAFDAAAFDAGVAAAGDGDALLARLFTARARVVGGGRPEAETASYLSGLLIGADVAATPTLLGPHPREPVHLVGDPELCAHYARAMALRGVSARTYSGEAASLRGLRAFHDLAVTA